VCSLEVNVILGILSEKNVRELFGARINRKKTGKRSSVYDVNRADYQLYVGPIDKCFLPLRLFMLSLTMVVNRHMPCVDKAVPPTC